MPVPSPAVGLLAGGLIVVLMIGAEIARSRQVPAATAERKRRELGWLGTAAVQVVTSVLTLAVVALWVLIQRRLADHGLTAEKATVFLVDVGLGIGVFSAVRHRRSSGRLQPRRILMTTYTAAIVVAVFALSAALGSGETATCDVTTTAQQPAIPDFNASEVHPQAVGQPLPARQPGLPAGSGELAGSRFVPGCLGG